MRKKLFGGLVALALVLAPAAAASADTYQPVTGGHGRIDKSVVAPGETVTYTADAASYTAGEKVTEKISGANGNSIALVSTVSAGNYAKAAEADGSLTFAITMPADGGGDYTLEVARVGGDVWDTFTITVLAADAATDAGSGSGLAMTGADIAIYTISGVAVLLLAAGVVLLVVRRRRAGADSAA